MLPYVLFAYRTSPQASTKETPFKLLYGRDARLPMDAALSAPVDCSTLDLVDYPSSWGLAGPVIRTFLLSLSHLHIVSSHVPSYGHPLGQLSQVGDSVFIWMPAGAKRKLARPYHGPYRVLNVSNFGVEAQLIAVNAHKSALGASDTRPLWNDWKESLFNMDIEPWRGEV